jgi:hypothetical protein
LAAPIESSNNEKIAAVHESAIGRYCCKSHRRRARSAKTGDIRIQTAGFVNQYSLFTLNPGKMFFAPSSKIFLQQYRHKADMAIALSDVRFWG